MVKSVLGVNHQGLKDWSIQRLTAILMAIYSIALILYFLLHPAISFTDWEDLFSQAWIKIATVLFMLSVIYHAWIGVWTIFTDYIKCFVIRIILNILVLLILGVSFIATIMILWSV